MSKPHFSQHSTGPRTEAGKAASSQNAAKHHLTAGRFRMTLGESESEYESLKAGLFEEHQPATLTERLLVERLAQSFWLVQRAIRCASREDCTDREVSLFMRYQTTQDRAFHQALKQLKALQAERKAEERGEPELNRQKKQLDIRLKQEKLAKFQAPALPKTVHAANAPPPAA